MVLMGLTLGRAQRMVVVLVRKKVHSGKGEGELGLRGQGGKILKCQNKYLRGTYISNGSLMN